MTKSIRIRAAEIEDIDFLIDCIVSAEKSGTDRVSYCTLFDLSETELRSILRQILLEDVSGQELCVSGFLIAEVNGEYAGAACSWIERYENKTSAELKSDLLIHFVGRDRIAAAKTKLDMVHKLTVVRVIDALQIESIAVLEKFQGMNICSKLLMEHELAAFRIKQDIVKAQIILSDDNIIAKRAYEKAGYSVVKKISSDLPELLHLLPSSGRYIMEKSIASDLI